VGFDILYLFKLLHFKTVSTREKLKCLIFNIKNLNS
jgi:hypothetical protein